MGLIDTDSLTDILPVLTLQFSVSPRPSSFSSDGQTNIFQLEFHLDFVITLDEYKTQFVGALVHRYIF